jgi:hypothetical protein
MLKPVKTKTARASGGTFASGAARFQRGKSFFLKSMAHTL